MRIYPHILVVLTQRRQINCQSLYTYNQVFGNAAIGLASVNLSLRTYVFLARPTQFLKLLMPCSV